MYIEYIELGAILQWSDSFPVSWKLRQCIQTFVTAAIGLLTSVSGIPTSGCSNVCSSTLKLTHIHKKYSSFLLFLFPFSWAALFGWVGKCVTKCPGKFEFKPQIQIRHVDSVWSQLFLMFSPVHMECWAGPGRGQQDSQESHRGPVSGSQSTGHAPVCTLDPHPWWQVWCADFALLCWGLTGPSLLTAPLSSWPSEGIGNSWMSSKPYSKSGKGCEIKFQISVLPVHTRGLLGRNQALWPLRVLLVLILLLQKGAIGSSLTYFHFPRCLHNHGANVASTKNVVFLLLPFLPRYPLRKILYGPQNLCPDASNQQ